MVIRISALVAVGCFGVVASACRRAMSSADGVAHIDELNAGLRTKREARNLAIGGSSYLAAALWPARASDDDAYAQTDSLIQLFGNSLTMSNNASFFSIGQPGWTSVAVGMRSLPTKNVFVSPNLVTPSPSTDTVPSAYETVLEAHSGFGWSQAVTSDGDVLLVGAPLDGQFEFGGFARAASAANATEPASPRAAQSVSILPGTGKAYLYTGCAARRCKLVATISSPNALALSAFGYAVAMPKNGRALVISDPLANNFSGAVYVWPCSKQGVCDTATSPTIIRGPSQGFDADLGNVDVSCNTGRRMQTGPSAGPLGIMLGAALPEIVSYSAFGASLQSMDSGLTVHVGSPSFGCGDSANGGKIFVYQRTGIKTFSSPYPPLMATAPKVSDQFGHSISSSRVIGGTVIVTSTPFYSLFDSVVELVAGESTSSNPSDVFVYMCRDLPKVNGLSPRCILVSRLAIDSSGFPQKEFARGLSVSVSDGSPNTIVVTGNVFSETTRRNLRGESDAAPSQARALSVCNVVWSTMHVFKLNPGTVLTSSNWFYTETYQDYTYGWIADLPAVFSRNIVVDATGSTIMSSQTMPGDLSFGGAGASFGASVVTVWTKNPI